MLPSPLTPLMQPELLKKSLRHIATITYLLTQNLANPFILSYFVQTL